MYLFITRFSTPYTAILLLSFILLAGCGQSDDQREFEREAYAMPDNFTETTGSGEIVQEDPDDWRVSPFYQASGVEVSPAYPNPAKTDEQITIDVDVWGYDSVPGLILVARYHEQNSRILIFESYQNPLPPGNTTINFSVSELGILDDGSRRGLHRVILLDNNENVISYGDIMVE